MSDKEQFDDYLKQTFSRYSPEVSPDTWDKIRAKQKDRKPKGFWWFQIPAKFAAITIAGILCITAGILVYNNHTTDEKNTATMSAKTNTTTPTADPTVTDQSTAATSNNNTSVIKTTDVESKSALSDNTLNNDHPVADAKTNATSIGKNNNQLSADNNQTVVAADQGSNRQLNKKIIGSKRSMRMKVGTSGSQAINDDVNDNADDVQPQTILSDNLPGKQFYEASSIAASSLANTQKRTFKNISIPCPTDEKDAAGNKKYIEFYAGPDYGLRSFSDTANSTFLQRRKESTKFTTAFSAGLRYTKVFSNGMSFRTGFNFSQINEKFSYAESNVTQLIYITDVASGDTTGSYIVRGTRYKTSGNRYRTLDIPIVIGYELGNGRLHANVNAGAIVNIRNWQKGTLLDTSFKPVNITDQSPYQYKTNLGVGFTAGVSLYYKLNDRFHFLAEPYFRYNFSPMSKEALTLKEKYTTIGLRLGLRFDLQ